MSDYAWGREIRRCTLRTLAAAVCAAASWGLMALDSTYGGSAAPALGAVIFVPLAVAGLAALVLLLNLGCCLIACARVEGARYLLAELPLRVITGRHRPSGSPDGMLEG